MNNFATNKTNLGWKVFAYHVIALLSLLVLVIGLIIG